MRRRWPLIVSLVAAGFLAAAALGQRPAPQLRVIAEAPVKIAGSHFAARERVTVRLGAGAASSRVARADARGSFTVRFAVSADPCNNALIVTARGATGDSASLKSNARACPPAP